MSQEMNGKKMDDAVDEQQQKAAQLDSAMSALRTFVHQTMTVTTRGVCGSVPQVPPPVVMIECARAMGELVGQFSSVGDIVPCMNLRADAKRAFEAGLQKHSIRPLARPGMKVS